MGKSYVGTSGDDSQAGTARDDHFDFSQGGADSLFGGAGHDVFYMGAAFDSGDRIEGGWGHDTVEIFGDFSAGLVLAAGNLSGVEQLNLDAGGSYNVVVQADALDPAGYFQFQLPGDGIVDASAVTTTTLDFLVGEGDLLRLRAGAMDDHFELDGRLSRQARFEGGAGRDTVLLEYGEGVYRAAGHTFQSVGEIDVFDSVNLVLNDANTAAGETLTIAYVGTVGRSAAVDGHKELDSHLDMSAGDGAVSFRGGHLSDVLEGGALRDTLEGGHGADTLTGGAGGDTFVYRTALDSRPDAPDLITDLKANDLIDLSAVDADRTLAGDQGFTQVSAFDGHAGELTLTYDGVRDLTVLAGDLDGDAEADFTVLIAGDHADFTGLVF